MFTGIVEELGQITEVTPLPDDALRLRIRGPEVTGDAAHGESIAVNGVCLTVVEVADGEFTADVMRDPVAALCLSTDLRRSMARMLEAAGVGTGGLKGALRIKGLGAVYLDAARVWFKDEDAGLSATMARLDKSLARAERMEGVCTGFRARNIFSGAESSADA